MSKQTAQVIWGILNLLAIVAVIYLINDYLRVADAIKQQQAEIDFDDGIYYLLLLSVFWPITLIQLLGLKHPQHTLVRQNHVVVVVWFVMMLVLSNIIPYQLSQKMHAAGYVAYADPTETARISKGDSFIFKLKP